MAGVAAQPRRVDGPGVAHAKHTSRRCEHEGGVRDKQQQNLISRSLRSDSLGKVGCMGVPRTWSPSRQQLLPGHKEPVCHLPPPPPPPWGVAGPRVLPVAMQKNVVESAQNCGVFITVCSCTFCASTPSASTGGT